MATIIEQVGSRRGSNSQPTRRYRVFGATDEIDALTTAAGFAPGTLGDLPLADFNYQEIDQIAGDYDVTAAYGRPLEPNNEYPAESTEFRFNFQATGGHFNFSLATILYATATGSNADPAVVGAPNFKQMLNVSIDDQGVPRAEGFDVQPPPEVFTLVYRDVDAAIDGAYQDTVLDLVGTVNSATFRGKPAGSVMLVRATGRRSGGLWNIEFGFGYVPNRTAITIGAITVSAADGMDLLWVFPGAERDDDYFGTIVTPRAAYVERVWRRANLNDLALPA